VYEPLPSLPLVLPLRSHRPLDDLYIQPDGQVFVVPVEPVGQQHGKKLLVFDEHCVLLLHTAAVADVV